MGANPIQKILDLLGPAVGELLKYGLLAVVVVVIFVIVWKLLGWKDRKPTPKQPDLTIDVLALGNQGPPAGAPVLEFYNVPVRLAAIVVAPAGRVRELPAINEMDDLFDSIVPGLANVVATHRPLVRSWPAQLSVKGFAHQFFQHVRLPGQGGKGTPWSSAAGVVKIEGQAVMAGMILRTDSTSSHGQETIDTEERWLACLRVKG
jgi:hypothetical protein